MSRSGCTPGCVVRAWSFALATLCVFASSARAQLPFFGSPDYLHGTPMSVRAAGMGGASVAVPWGDQPDTWANPALLGLVSGVRVRTERNAEAGERRARQETWGVGAFGVGGEFRSADRDEDDESMDSKAVGVSLARVLRGLGRISGHPSPWVDRVDAGFGFARHELRRGGASVFNTRTETTLDDWGAYVRARPWHDTLDPAAASHQLSFAYGHAVRNSGAASLPIESGAFDTDLPRVHQDGIGVHYAYRREHGEGLPGIVRSPFNAGLDPALELTLAWDLERIDYGRGPGGSYERTHIGAEATALRMLSARAGWVDSPYEDRVGTTWGVGLALPLARVAGVRTDWAWEPATAADAADRSPSWSASAWLDLVSWLTDRRSPQGGPR